MNESVGATPTTRNLLLAAAERLFAERGIEGASLRAITDAAGANLAAVHYHFGSKEELARAVFLRRLRPINEERLRRLDRLEAEASPGTPPLEAIVEAFVAPVLRLVRDDSGGGRLFAQLMGRALTSPNSFIHGAVLAEIRPILERFLATLSRCLPELPPSETLWRVYFGVGAMAHTVSSVGLLGKLSDGLCDPADVDGTVARLVTFIAAGLRAPAGSPAAVEGSP